MNAMILAAGRGERMRPLTDTCPKPLLPVNGKPLIVYHLEALKRAGINSVVINHSWLGEKIERQLGDGSCYGLNIQYSRETQALETAGGIMHAFDKLEDEFLVVNGDVYTDYDFSRLLNPAQEAHLVLIPNPVHHPQGDFSIVQGWLSNTAGIHNGEQRYTFSGIARYKKSFFYGLSPGKQALRPLFEAGADQKRISAELYQGSWSDIGTLARLDSIRMPS